MGWRNIIQPYEKRHLRTIPGNHIVGPKFPPPNPVRVPDEAAALKIAEPALIKTYGKRQIDNERPLKATLDKGIWIVSGTLCCTDRNGNRTCEQGTCVGGTAVLKLRQRDGKILSIIHHK